MVDDVADGNRRSGRRSVGLFRRLFGKPTIDEFANQFVRELGKADRTNEFRLEIADHRIVRICDGKENGVTNLDNIEGVTWLSSFLRFRNWITGLPGTVCHRRRMADDRRLSLQAPARFSTSFSSCTERQVLIQRFSLNAHVLQVVTRPSVEAGPAGPSISFPCDLHLRRGQIFVLERGT